MGLSVSIEPLMSEQLDLPSTIAPAPFRRRTASASSSATLSRRRSEPAVNRTSATAIASLTVIGTPWRGGGSEGTPASVSRRAVLRAASNVVVISALMCGSTSSIRAMCASTTSTWWRPSVAPLDSTSADWRATSVAATAKATSDSLPTGDREQPPRVPQAPAWR